MPVTVPLGQRLSRRAMLPPFMPLTISLPKKPSGFFVLLKNQHGHLHVGRHPQHATLHRNLATMQPLHRPCFGASGSKRWPTLLQTRLLPVDTYGGRLREGAPRCGDGETRMVPSRNMASTCSTGSSGAPAWMRMPNWFSMLTAPWPNPPRSTSEQPCSAKNFGIAPCSCSGACSTFESTIFPSSTLKMVTCGAFPKCCHSMPSLEGMAIL